MDKEALPAGTTQTDGRPAKPAASVNQGRKKPSITVTTRSIAEVGLGKDGGQGVGRPRPSRAARVARVKTSLEQVEPVEGTSPPPKGAATVTAPVTRPPVRDKTVKAAESKIAETKAIEKVVKAQQEVAATPAAVVPPAVTSAATRPAAAEGEQRFPFLSEGRALETTVGEAILQAAAALGVPEDALAVDTLLVRRNLRSGQQLRHYGHVVIIGDVNAGAEVIATGDIIVVGALRGLAHAGAVGNEDSIVAAYYLRPTQLRVANYIGRAPDQPDPNYQGPEVARVRGGRLVVEPYRVLAGRDL